MVITLLEWIIPLAMVPLVARRHLPAPAIAWLTFIFFKPWLGLFLYIFIGENIIIRRRIKTYCQSLAEVRTLALVNENFEAFKPPADPCSSRMVELTERLSCMPIIHGNSVELLDDGNEVLHRLIQEIDGAENHVHLLFYIYADDEAGRSVSEALSRAASRGVRCRLVLDAFGARSLNSSLGDWLVSKGIELHYLMPANPFRRHLSRIDMRNHRKLAIIDGRAAFTGSQNIEMRDYDRRRPEAWHDLMVRIVGPAVLKLQVIFIEDWYFATGAHLEDASIFPPAEVAGHTPIQAVPSGPHDPAVSLRDLLIAAIYEARERIIITSPYFIPDEPSLLALSLAAHRGVRVDLLIPRQADHPVVGAVARSHFDKLFEAGINIHFHRGVLHSKTMSVDRHLAVIGTANFDPRSFHLHSELSLLLYGTEVTERLRGKQSEYIGQSDLVDPKRWTQRPWIKRRRDEVLKLLTPLL